MLTKPLTILLPTPEHTALLGRQLAARLLTHAPLRTLLLQGPLGSGKTTLTRALTLALPGGNMAEVSSPSFTLCHLYPTTPKVLHCDLYRTGAGLPDDVWEALDDTGCTRPVVIIEWSEHLPRVALPPEYLDIRLDICHIGRLATVEPHGETAYGAVLQLQHEEWTL